MDLDDLQRVRFAVVAIETAAVRMGVSTAELVQRLEKHDLIEQRLFKFYDTLHTQSKEYVVDDIIL